MAAKVSEAASEVAGANAVVLDRVAKVYTTQRVEAHALVDATLHVADGEFVAVMGPSGSGKSTLLHLVAGLDVPTSGAVYVQGHCVSSMSDDAATAFRRQHIGFIYQRFNFLADLTVQENVGLPLILDGLPTTEVRGRVATLLERLDLQHRREHLPAEISGGELQRAAIARALVAEPAVLLADEPTGNLDSSSGERVLLDMRRAVDELGRTVILVTHDPRAAAYADRIERLLDGCFEDR